ncbi:MAG: hypothetical protein ACK4KW_11890 [Gemmobacter sp.]
MQIAVHLGAHCTDEGAVLRCLMRNADLLTAEGIAVPDPAQYRAALREAVEALGAGIPAPGQRDALLAGLAGTSAPDRVVLSLDTLMAFPRWTLGRGLFYPVAAERLAALRALLAGTELELFLAIRDPATFLPALFERQRVKSYQEFVEGTDPLLLRWSELAERLVAAVPGVPLTVWCDEDTPLILPEVLREIAGLDPWTQLQGDTENLRGIMAPEGYARLLDYLARTPPQTEIQRRRIVAAFLDKYVLPEKVEMELDLPGWTDAYVAAISAAYDEDVDRLRRLPGVRLIAP